MQELERLAGSQLVEAGLQAGQAAHRGEVGEIEFQAAENAVERVVAADDHFDGGGAERSGLHRARARRQGPAPRPCWGRVGD